MVSLLQAKNLSVAFVKDACNYLAVNSDSIRIIFAPYVEPKKLVPQLAEVLYDDTIVIGEDLLNKFREVNSFTPLRKEMYSRVRFIAKRRETNGILTWIDEMEDANNYGMALLFLKGLQISCPIEPDHNSYFAGALKILAFEFNLHGNIFRTNAVPYKGMYFYKVHLYDEDREKFIRKFYRKTSFTSKEPLLGESGTIENPFNNIYDAVHYLEKVEHKAYEEDTLINDIANMKYFYDPIQGHFRIAWASPYVAVQKNSFPRNSFIMSQMAQINPSEPNFFYFSLKPNLYGHKFLYRGQSNYYPGKPCKPNMYRDPNHNDTDYFLDYIIFSQEMEILIKSHPLVNLLEKGIEILHDTFRIRMNYPGLIQHYYNKSNMLDLTSDVKVMEFFATTDYKSETDEYVPVTDAKGIGVIYYYELKYPEAFQQHEHYALKTIGKQVFSRSGLQSGFLLEMDKTADMKTNIPEVKKIYFRHDAEISKKIFAASSNGEVYFPDDILQHAWHDRMKQRFKEKVVSIKAVQLNVSRNQDETEESITNKLKDRGISVDNFEPIFSEEELQQFYANIEQWWNDFCSDIYFADAENNIYRQAMKEIIREPKYAWAFYKKN
jgi:hypothetical protein